MNDLISRQDAIDAIKKWGLIDGLAEGQAIEILADEEKVPPAQPTIYGYNVEHLELIARILQKENMSPERVVDVLTDVGGIVAIIRDEFEETLRKAVEQCTI